MNKKYLYAVVSVLLVVIMSLCSMTVFAVENDNIAPIPVETEAIEDDLDGFIEIPERPASTEDPDSTGDTNQSDNEDNSEPEPQEVVYKAGDVNGDGEINVIDVTDYQLTLVGKKEITPAFTKNCNTVTDAKTNIIDATAIQYYIARTFIKLPITPDGYYAEIIRP